MFNFNTSFFAITASVVSVVAFIPYIWAILKGQTKPSGPSWWTWTFITFVTVLSSWVAGASWQILLLPTWLCFSQLTVSILSIRFGDNKWDLLNKACIGLACLGIVAWLVTGQPIIALIISITADIFASIPNLRHIWVKPGQENLLGWTLGWLSSFFEIFAIARWSIAESSWAIYFFLMMSITLLLIARPIFLRFQLGKNV